MMTITVPWITIGSLTLNQTGQSRSLMNTSPAPEFHLDKSSRLPLYLQLVNSIKSAITEGRLHAGDVLPPERELAEMLDIARGTVRKALLQLLEGGVLVRNQGVGTFIAPHVCPSLPLLESFSEMATASGGTAQSELLGYLRRPSALEERSVLQMTQDNGDVVELTRLRKVNGITVSLQIAILPAHFLDNISELDESLYWHLEKKGAQVLRATQHFSAAVTDSTLAHYLGTDEYEPVLLVTRTGFTHNDRPVEYTRTWYLNDYCDFTIDLHRKDL
ncbi:putative transcriptional regulator [Yersinia pseudotuberculosis IP 32953]|uniref:Putative transcriptional regulator n=2 Tax=Yersinia pseudotuberculosis TaxID=633 RepID=Q66AE7_YERPS|nr:putative transcriptional regulator [Yersinia pseudotuberculosis IP 32953]